MLSAPATLLTFIGETISTLFLPRECVGCGVTGTVLCSECEHRIDTTPTPRCPACWKPSPYGETHTLCIRATTLSGIHIAGRRTNPILATAINAYKYEGARCLANPLGAFLIRSCLESPLIHELLSDPSTLLVPVPLHPKKEYVRTFNQSTLLATILASACHCTLATTLFTRTINTPSQTRLSRDKRYGNSADAFSCRTPQTVRGRTIIFLDDIITSGATMHALAQLARSAGAVSVWGIALSHG